MDICRLTIRIAPLLLVISASAYAGNGPPPPPPPTSPPLDVTMRIVPLNANIEKSVVQTIVVPMNVPVIRPVKTSPRNRVTSGKSPTLPRRPNFHERVRIQAERQAADARRDATEAAKEAKKDRDNSSTKGRGQIPSP